SQLYVGELSKMTKFYKEQVGLNVLESSTDKVLLGHDQTRIIELVEKTKLLHEPAHSAGLFHNAILFSSQGALSRAVGEIIMATPQLYSGTGDHLVSEAFYFNDPEGNGVELYYDRPTSEWQWVNGQIVMDTLYIDPIAYIQTHASKRPESHKKLGHIHLKIGDIEQARQFYVTLLGFTVTADIGSALFVSVAGYHHHIGLNTWLSKGADKRMPSLGLSAVTITLMNESDVSNLAVRLENARYPFRHVNGKIHVADPWNNSLIVKAA
ncbi:MAG TPA: VOC family protein, partial [Candidatus Saccharimonadales bacterium]|nr:VOC family protein [Candidatus Saccharimonadales bacterium]